MYELIIVRTNGKEERNKIEKKPNFKDLYRYLNCDMIEMLRGYNKNISNRSFDIYADECSKLKYPFYKNYKATGFWRTWLKRNMGIKETDSYIAGDIAIINKLKR